MTRSFSDRVLGGVCGGMAGALRLNGWVVRGLFAVGAVLTSGAVLVLYAALWLAMPQGSPVLRRGGFGSTLAVLLLTAAVIGLWVAERAGALAVEQTGQSLYLPALATLLAVVFLLRQVRGS